MKKFLIYWFILLLSILNVYSESHIDVRLYENTYSPGSSLQADISLNTIKPIDPKDVWIADKYGQKTKISPFLLNLQNSKYFLYFDIPSSLSPGDYNLLIENLFHASDGKLIQDDYTVNFSVVDGVGISLDPAGKIFNSPGQFLVKVKSSDDADVTIKTSGNIQHAYSAIQHLQKDKAREFKFNVLNINSDEKITFSYSGKETSAILFYTSNILNSTSSEKNQTGAVITKTPFEIGSDIKSIEKVIETSENIYGYVNIKNNLDTDLDINIEISSEILDIVQAQSYLKIGPGSYYNLPIEINPSRNAPAGEYSGSLTIKGGDLSITLPVEINVINEVGVGTVEKKGERKEPAKKENEFFEFNFTEVTPPVSPKRPRVSLIVFVIILIILGIAYYLSKKKVVEKKSFGEMLRGIERRKK